MITHENFRNTTTMAASVVAGDGDMDGTETAYLFLPLAHVFARLLQFTSLDVGGTIAFWRRDPQLIIADIGSSSPRVLPSVPRIFEKIFALAQSGDAGQDRRRSRRSGARRSRSATRCRMLQEAGEPVPAELQAGLRRGRRARLLGRARTLFGGRVKRAITGAAPISRRSCSSSTPAASRSTRATA